MESSEIDRTKCCCFTGHRHIPEEERNLLWEKLLSCIRRLNEDNGVTTFYAGGCTGFDTLAAKAVLEYREDHAEVQLIIVVPYADQSRGWSQAEKDEYERIKGAASDVVCLAGHYFNGCMQRRNRHMVDRSAVCVCYQTKEYGGTAFTVKFAQAKGLTIHNLATDPMRIPLQEQSNRDNGCDES